MATRRSPKPARASTIPPVRVQDNDPRSYLGGAYLTGMVAKLAIVQLSRWSDKVVNKGDAKVGFSFVGFRCYRPYRKDLTE